MKFYAAQGPVLCLNLTIFVPFLADDILWFKPVELRTKWGRRGHIKEALGEKKKEKKNPDAQFFIVELNSSFIQS